MRHYLFLSIQHAIRKYVDVRFDRAEVESGWFGWRTKLKPEMIKLPSEAELRPYISDDELDPSNPRTKHYMEDFIQLAQQKSEQSVLKK